MPVLFPVAGRSSRRHTIPRSGVYSNSTDVQRSSLVNDVDNCRMNTQSTSPLHPPHGNHIAPGIVGKRTSINVGTGHLQHTVRFCWIISERSVRRRNSLPKKYTKVVPIQADVRLALNVAISLVAERHCRTRVRVGSFCMRCADEAVQVVVSKFVTESSNGDLRIVTHCQSHPKRVQHPESSCHRH